jgi:hypothetical protein
MAVELGKNITINEVMPIIQKHICPMLKQVSV